MLAYLVLSNWIWLALDYLPVTFAIIGGILVTIGCIARQGWPPVCRRCGHQFPTLESEHCVECGADLTAPGGRCAGRRRMRWRWLLIGCVAIAVSMLAQPPLRWGPRLARPWLAARLSSDDLVAQANGSQMVMQILHQRISDSEPGLGAAYLRAMEGLAGDRGLPGPTDRRTQFARSLMESGALNADEIERLARLVIAELASGRATSASIAPLVMAFGLHEAPAESSSLVIRTLLSDHGMRQALTEPTIHTPIIKDRAFSVHVSSILLSLWSSAGTTQIDVAPIEWRLRGESPWRTPKAEQNRFEGALSLTQFGLVDSAGEIELRVRGTLRLPKIAKEATSSEEDSVAYEHVVPARVLTEESIEATPVDSEALRAIAAERFGNLRLRQMDRGQIRLTHNNRIFGRKPAESAARGPEFCGGHIEVEQDHAWVRSGTITLRGSDGLSMAGGSFPAPAGGHPIVIRLVPDADAFRQSAQDAFQFLAAIAELTFATPESEPTIRWITPAP